MVFKLRDCAKILFSLMLPLILFIKLNRALQFVVEKILKCINESNIF